MEDCECKQWARIDPPGHPATNHHPNCPHVNDSLIDVWRLHLPGEKGGMVFDQHSHAVDAQEYEAVGDGLEITPEKMHREVYERLPEFEGF